MHEAIVSSRIAHIDAGRLGQLQLLLSWPAGPDCITLTASICHSSATFGMQAMPAAVEK